MTSSFQLTDLDKYRRNKTLHRNLNTALGGGWDDLKRILISKISPSKQVQSVQSGQSDQEQELKELKKLKEEHKQWVLKHLAEQHTQRALERLILERDQRKKPYEQTLNELKTKAEDLKGIMNEYGIPYIADHTQSGSRFESEMINFEAKIDKAITNLPKHVIGIPIEKNFFDEIFTYLSNIKRNLAKLNELKPDQTQRIEIILNNLLFFFGNIPEGNFISYDFTFKSLLHKILEILES